MPAISRPRSSRWAFELGAARLVREALDRHVVEEAAELDSVVAPRRERPAAPDRASPAARTRTPCTSFPADLRFFAIRMLLVGRLSVASVHEQAAVDVNVRTVDVGGAASEASMTHDCGHFLGGPDAPERRLRRSRAAWASGGHAAIIGVSITPGLTALHVTPCGPAVAGDRLRQRGDPSLGGGIRRACRETAGLSGERRDGHDATAPLRDHHPQRRLAGEERSLQVHGLDAIPFLCRDLVERRRVEDPGAGDEDVQAPASGQARSRRASRHASGAA